MPTLNKNIPRSLDGIAFEGGYNPASDNVGAQELDSLQTNNGTSYGPLRFVNSALAGIIGQSTTLTETVANTDGSFTFTAQVRHVMIQNNTGVPVWFSLDATATPASMQLLPGAQFTADIRVTTVHLLTTTIQHVNGGSGVGSPFSNTIVVWGWN